MVLEGFQLSLVDNFDARDAAGIITGLGTLPAAENAENDTPVNRTSGGLGRPK